MRIALYKGVSFLSRTIMWKTWSDASHVAWEDDDGAVIQAWRHGVTRDASVSDRHEPGTIIRLYRVPVATSRMIWKQREFLKGELGKPYDVPGIMGFVQRRNTQRQDRWFCSELVFQAFRMSGLELLKRIAPHKVSPALIEISPYLELDEVITV